MGLLDRMLGRKAVDGGRVDEPVADPYRSGNIGGNELLGPGARPTAVPRTSSRAPSSPVPPEKREPSDTSAAVFAWLERLGEVRPDACDRLTDELLTEVGNPPVPPKHDPSNSTAALMAYFEARSAGSLMAAKLSRKAYLDLGAAEKANDAHGMELADIRARFWSDVSGWFEQSYR
jgi:hypothetical protein